MGRTDTRRRVLETAATLFHSQGYHATGVNQVLAEGGAPKGVLYFHFPGGKEQLAVEAVDLVGGSQCQLIEAVLAAAATPMEAVDQLIEALASALVASDYREGCPVAAVALEMAAVSEPIRTASDTAYRSWRKVISAYLCENGAEPVRAESTATVALAAIEGGLLLAKTSRDTAPLLEVGRFLRAAVADTIGS